MNEKPALPSSDDAITISGAREHNLQDVHLVLPKNRLIVFTGVSGSGKSSMAFDTLYAEGQRRFVESLSAYARQFIGQLERPKVDRIRGLSPTIAIAQQTTGSSPRSTVGTTTEIYDYLRLLYARVGVTHCPSCGRRTEKASPDDVVAAILSRPAGQRLLLLAPIAQQKKGAFVDELAALRAQGYSRFWLDGAQAEGDALPALDKNKKHDVAVIIDRIVVRPDPTGTAASRLRDSVETALRVADGTCAVRDLESGTEALYSTSRACLACGVGIPEPTPALFSFNSPVGACPSCSGIGTRQEVDIDSVVPDPSRSLSAGCIAPWSSSTSEAQSRWVRGVLQGLANRYGIDLDAPWAALTDEQRKRILFGTGGEVIDVPFPSKTGETVIPMAFEGLVPTLERQKTEPTGETDAETRPSYLREVPCGSCGGDRLRGESRAVRVADRSITELVQLPLGALAAWFHSIALTGNAAIVGHEILRELRARIGFLVDVGLDYLTLRRGTATLSGGEAQRIRLASQIGSELSGVLYVLDEPSIGLHPRDTDRLVRTLKALRDLGNTVVVVEHDSDTMRAADWLVDFGPGAGIHGGRVVAEGTVATVSKAPESLTGAYLSGRKTLPPAPKRRNPSGSLLIRGARANNLQGIDVRIPLGAFVIVTGVSGAGKSSLVNAILYPALARRLQRAAMPVGSHDGIDGVEALERVIAIDQRAIGRTPRSNPATYTKLWDAIRKVFAETREARVLGFDAGRFSFNVKGGRCEACEGVGQVKVEMHFLADLYVTCETCRGRRFNEATLQVRYRDLTIHDVLELTVDQARELFSSHPSIRRTLDTLEAVGLGYMRLGQPGQTLSGGEAQRVKLSRELSRPGSMKTLYVMDEPSTGLHFEDVGRLLHVVHRLVDTGHTVVMIEHDVDIIQRADWVIDLGPEGGESGGRVVVAGRPEDVAACVESHTGRALRAMMI